MSGYLQGRFAQQGVALENHVFTLDATQSPTDDLQFGWTLFAGGLVLQLIVCVLVWLVFRSRRTPSGK